MAEMYVKNPTTGEVEPLDSPVEVVGNISYEDATQTESGLMSAADKKKLDGLSPITVDSSLIPESTNPVQSKVIQAELKGIGSAIPIEVLPAGESITLNPNVLTRLNTPLPASITISLAAPIEGIRNEYMFQFSTVEDTEVTFNIQGLKWLNGKQPVISRENHYELSITCGLYGFYNAVLGEF